jgi:hypothetical protein
MYRLGLGWRVSFYYSTGFRYQKNEKEKMFPPLWCELVKKNLIFCYFYPIRGGTKIAKGSKEEVKGSWWLGGEHYLSKDDYHLPFPNLLFSNFFAIFWYLSEINFLFVKLSQNSEIFSLSEKATSTSKPH